MFWMGRAGKGLCTNGMLRRIEPGPRATLDDRCRNLFATMQPDDPAILVGALPFDVDAGEFLFQPAAIRREADLSSLPVGVAAGSNAFLNGSVREVPAAGDYARAVLRALRRIAASDNGGLSKVVLARQMLLECSGPLDFSGLLRELSQDRHVTTYCLDLDPVNGGGDHVLIGATPELLVARNGANVRSDPLAGSMPRSRDAGEDRRRADALLASDKDRREHAIVVEYVLDLLSPFCSQLGTPHGTTLRSTASMWHLGTSIEGVLKPDAPTSAGLAAILHPTPAVGGYPVQPALQAIAELERHDRGYYAGAVGYTDSAGDGEWYVALRCAELAGSHLALHAGAGIVEGSDPDAEVVETAAKFRAMLRALGLADDAVVAEGVAQ